MKKEKIVKIQKILGIILLVAGIVLLCWNIYDLNKIRNYEKGIIADYDSFYLSNEEAIITQNYSPGLLEQEKEFLNSLDSIEDIKRFSIHSIYFSLILIVLGIVTLLQVAFNKAKK